MTRPGRVESPWPAYRAWLARWTREHGYWILEEQHAVGQQAQQHYFSLREPAFACINPLVLRLSQQQQQQNWGGAWALQLRVAAESNGKVAKLACGGGLAHIDVTAASFGRSCFGGHRSDACTGPCAAECSKCTAEQCPAIRAELSKCSSPDVTSVVAGACNGRQQCDFSICIAGSGQTVADKPACTDPTAHWPLGEPAFGCKKEFVVSPKCSSTNWRHATKVLIKRVAIASCPPHAGHVRVHSSSLVFQRPRIAG